MPTYDYRCDKCDHHWELFQSIKAEPEKKCPACGKKAAKRLISAGGGVIFKGSGFYQTDYRSDGYKKAAAADKKSSEPANCGADACKTGCQSTKESKSAAAE
jgi:putative FmdB family regulatory protein